MDTQSLAQATERVLEILREARPEMGGRIEKAENLLVTQISVSNGVCPIRATIHADGGRSYTVRSGSKLERSYTVDPTDWTDDCPATKTCYHVIACWTLEQVGEQLGKAGKSPAVAPCDGCGERYPVSEMATIKEDDPRFLGTPLAHFAGDALCPACFEGAA